MGVVFVIDGDQTLLGSLSDGDIRRALLNDRFDLSAPVTEVMKSQPSVLPVGSDSETTFAVLSRGIREGKRVFPRTDEDGQIRSFAYRDHWGLIPIAEPSLNGNEFKYLTDCLESNWISSNGPYIGRFEEAFARYTELPNSIAVANGTIALTLALQALGIPGGAEVVVPDCTFAATANAVIAAGGRPVFADIDSTTWGLSPESVREVLGPDTWGILAVHLYGNPCDVEELRVLCDQEGLKLVEDCAEAIGTRVAGRHVGCFGDAAAFSFFGNKTLTTGEGGMVTFREGHVVESARMLRDHGMSRTRRYWHEVVGFNYRMTNLQAAIGLAQVERVEDMVRRKIANAAILSSALETNSFVSSMPLSSFGECSFWLFPLLLEIDDSCQRGEFMDFMASCGVQTRVTFPSLHQMPPFEACRRSRNLANSLEVSQRGVCLPNSPSMTEGDLELMRQTLTAFTTNGEIRHGY